MNGKRRGRASWTLAAAALVFCASVAACESDDSKPVYRSGSDSTVANTRAYALDDDPLAARCTVHIRDLEGTEILVDTRPGSQREKRPVRHTLSGVATNLGFYRNYAPELVVLVGGGLDDRRLLERCTESQRNGADNVRVLIGGARLLEATGKASIPGLPVPDSRLIQATDLRRLARAGTSIHAADGRSPARTEESAATWSGILGTEVGVAIDADIVRGDEMTSGIDPVVIVLPVGESPGAWHERLGLAAHDNVVFFNQGPDAYVSGVERADAIARHAYRLPVREGCRG